MKNLLLTVCGLCLVLILGCVPSPNLKQGDAFYAGQDYVQALRHYEMALGEVRGDTARRELEQKIASTRQHLVRMTLAKAESAARNNDPDALGAVRQAIAIAQEALQWESGEGDVQKRLDAYQARSRDLEAEKNELRRQSLAAIGEYDFSRAMELIEQAQGIDAEDPVLQDLAAKAPVMLELDQAGQKALNNNNIDQAVAAFEQMQEISPAPLSFANYPLYEDIVDLVKKRVTQMELENRWYDAYALLTTLDFEEFAQDLKRVRASGSQYYYQRSSVAILDNGDYHHAYLLALLASMLDDSDLRIFRRLQETQDYVNQSIQSYIAVATFDSPSNDPDAGRQFSDSLISYLYSVLPYGINILERDKIDFVLQEQNSDNRSAGQMLGVDLMVTGSVSLFRVDTSVDKRNATATVTMGEEQVPNPEYQQMVSTYGPSPDAWPRIPPMMTTRELTESVSYTRGMAESKGFAKVSVRIFDTEKGAISFVKDFDADVGYVAEFNDAVEEAGIEYTPMRLPSETEIKEQIRREIVAQVAEVVESSFTAREHRFLNQAQFYIDRRQPQLAIRPIAQGYYYALQDGIAEDNPAFERIRELIPELAENFVGVSSKFSVQ